MVSSWQGWHIHTPLGEPSQPLCCERDTQQASSETGSTAMWPASGREAEVRGGIVSSLLSLLNQDAGVSSKSRCPRSSGNTQLSEWGESQAPEQGKRAPWGREGLRAECGRFRSRRWAETAEGAWLDLTLPTLTFYIFWLQTRRGSGMAMTGEHLHVMGERRDPGKEAEKEPGSQRATPTLLGS